MDEKLMKLRFVAEQKRSREISQKLKASEKDRIPSKKPSVVEPTVEPTTPQPAPTPELKATVKAAPKPRTAGSGKRLGRFGGSSLRDAIILSEIISKPVSRR